MPKLNLCPSILSANLLELSKTLDILADFGLKTLHIDIMDGHFVPEISFGPRIIELIKQHYPFYLDTHLMLSNPEAVLPRYIDAGADAISVHMECGGHLDRMLQLLKRQNIHTGLAFNPATAVNLEEGIWTMVDRVILMSVNPGFGGQKFIPYTLEKLRKLQSYLVSKGQEIAICMDGGVELQNIVSLAEAGASDVVVGSYLFSGTSIKERLVLLQNQLAQNNIQIA